MWSMVSSSNERRGGDDMTTRRRRGGDDMGTTWRLCGDNMTTRLRNSVERRGMLSTISSMVTAAMVTTPTATTYCHTACHYANKPYFANLSYWQKIRLVGSPNHNMATDLVAAWRQYGNRMATGWWQYGNTIVSIFFTNSRVAMALVTMKSSLDSLWPPRPSSWFEGRTRAL